MKITDTIGVFPHLEGIAQNYDLLYCRKVYISVV